MNKLIYKFSFVLGIVFLFAACEKDRTFPEFHEIEHGAFPRLLGSVTGPYGAAFNFLDVPGSFVEFTVEFYDDQNGNTVDSYEWTVSHAPTGTSAIIETAGRSQFTTNANGLPSVTLNFTFQEVLDALGISYDDVNGGETFAFTARLRTNRGQTFDRTNTNAVTQGQPAFRAFFQFNVPLVCPSALAGTYLSTTTGTSTDDCCPGETTVTGTVTLTSTGTGVYTLSDWSAGLYLHWYAIYGITPMTNLTAVFTDACKVYSIADKPEPFGTVVDFSDVTLDESTGVITYRWVNGYGDEAVVTLTPQ